MKDISANIFDVLQTIPQDDCHQIVVKIPGNDITAVRRSLRVSLRQHLFGWDSLLSLRLRYGLAGFCEVSFAHGRFRHTLTLRDQRTIKDKGTRAKFGSTAARLHSTLSCRALKILLRHLRAVVSWLSGMLHLDLAKASTFTINSGRCTLCLKSCCTGFTRRKPRRFESRGKSTSARTRRNISEWWPEPLQGALPCVRGGDFLGQPEQRDLSK